MTTSERIVKAVQSGKYKTVAEMAKALKIQRTFLHYHLANMVAAGILTKSSGFPYKIKKQKHAP